MIYTEIPENILPLIEECARNVHETWSEGRKAEGWKYGPLRNDTTKETPCLVPYDELCDSEKEYDRQTVMQTIGFIISRGWKLLPPEE